MIEKPSLLNVKLSRLQRKIEKLKKQRDYHAQRHEYYAKVISMQPYIEKRWTDYQERKNEQERVKNLEQRVDEQALLIRILSKEPIYPSEIKRAYDKIIKEEQQKINDEKKN